MPHQCVRCNTFYEDGSAEIMTGCKCGGKLFFYIRKEKLEEAKKLADKNKLSATEKEEIEKDVLDMVGVTKDNDAPVVLDFESVNVLKPGQYHIDLVRLFKEEPLIFKVEDGKYIIDIAETLNLLSTKKKKK
jgi:predicted  nucleic acid-binding Zn-ribbon protein